MTDWERCRGWIEAALTGGDIDEVERSLGFPGVEFWPGERCAVVAQLLCPMGVKEYHLLLAGGDLDELVRMERNLLEPRARELGCIRMIAPGRKGWARALNYQLAFSSVKELPWVSA